MAWRAKGEALREERYERFECRSLDELNASPGSVKDLETTGAAPSNSAPQFPPPSTLALAGFVPQSVPAGLLALGRFFSGLVVPDLPLRETSPT
jgi:hypothetical protein